MVASKEIKLVQKWPRQRSAQIFSPGDVFWLYVVAVMQEASLKNGFYG